MKGLHVSRRLEDLSDNRGGGFVKLTGMGHSQDVAGSRGKEDTNIN